MTTHESTQTRLAQLESKLTAADAAATHLAQECADKTFRIQQLEELLKAALADVDQYRMMGERVATDTALNIGACIDSIVGELVAARQSLQRSYEINQNLQAILPDQESLQAVHEELDEQTRVLNAGYTRLDDWINGNDEDVKTPSEAAPGPKCQCGDDMFLDGDCWQCPNEACRDHRKLTEHVGMHLVVDVSRGKGPAS